MHSLIFFILWIFFIVLPVQARSIDKIESDNGIEMPNEANDKQLFLKKYSKLLTYFKDRQTNIHNDDNNDLSSSSSEDVKQMPKRGFFLFPNRRSSQRYRPIYSYGRKSHWDTFFG